MRHQVAILVGLAQNEEQAHQECDHIPAAQPEDVAAFGREHAHLAGERRGNQDQRDRDGLVQIQFCRWRRPIPAGLSSCREIEREQPSKEH